MRVGLITVQQYISGPAVPMLRVRRGTHLVADCRTIQVVEQFVDLARLYLEHLDPAATRRATG